MVSITETTAGTQEFTGGVPQTKKKKSGGKMSTHCQKAAVLGEVFSLPFDVISIAHMNQIVGSMALNCQFLSPKKQIGSIE